ncbi:MAG: YmdB family metallophosphoesterase [bacterium]|nr:YmdB family metallophosphoesterase [bacterium]
MKLLFIADIMGKPGRQAVQHHLPQLVGEQKLDIVIANCENSAGGTGFTAKIAGQLFNLGIHLLTGGNHSFDNKDGAAYLAATDRVLRPHNFPAGNPGSGRGIIPLPDGGEMLVINLQGRVFMLPIDCPFQTADTLLAEWGDRGPVIVDMHAEASSEKIALARHLDGRVTAIFGTHTHVQTADAQVLPGGTALISDAGMTGPHGGVIGMETEFVVHRFRYQTLRRFQVSKDDIRLQGALLEFDDDTGQALSIEAIDLPLAL